MMNNDNQKNNNNRPGDFNEMLINPLSKINADNGFYKEEEPLSNSTLRRGMFHATLFAFFFSLNTILVKEAKLLSPDAFTPYNFIFWRGVSLTPSLYYILKKNDPNFNPINSITNKYWLLTRSLGFFLSFLLFIYSVLLLRVSFAQVIGSISPLVALLAAVIILEEKFHLRYIAGIALCFIGSAIIVLNEKGNNNDITTDPVSFYLGLLVAFMNVIVFGFVMVSQKVLIDSGMDNTLQVFYISIAMLCCSTVMCVFTWNFGFDFWIVSLSILNSYFFYLANYFAQESLKVLKVSGCVPFNYLQTIFVFAMCVVILKEKLFVTDIIGSLIIVSFHGYNSWNPIK